MFAHLRACLVLGCAAALLAACAGRSPAVAGTTRSQMVTAEEIEASGASTAWEALQAIVPLVTFQGTERRGKGDSRGPMRITRRGRSSVLLRDDPRVFLDHVRLVDISVLDQIPARDLWSIEVLAGIDATTYYGTGATNGVVLIRTRGSVAPTREGES